MTGVNMFEKEAEERAKRPEELEKENADERLFVQIQGKD